MSSKRGVEYFGVCLSATAPFLSRGERSCIDHVWQIWVVRQVDLLWLYTSDFNLVIIRNNGFYAAIPLSAIMSLTFKLVIVMGRAGIFCFFTAAFKASGLLQVSGMK